MSLNEAGYTPGEALLRKVQASQSPVNHPAIKKAYARYAKLVGNPQTTRPIENWLAWNQQNNPKYIQDLMGNVSLLENARQMGAYGPQM